MGVSGGRKRGGLWVVVLWLGILLSAQAAAAAPNFVILLTDDQRWDARTLLAMPFSTGTRLMPWMSRNRGTDASSRSVGARSSRFLYEYFYETGFYVPNLVALQRGRYKLVRYLSNPSWTELFDLTRDPWRLPISRPVRPPH